MKTIIKSYALVAFVTSFSLSLFAEDVASSQSSEPVSLIESLKQGKLSINSRLRYESFDLDAAGTLPDGGLKDRSGQSLRIRYGYTTPEINGFKAMIEGETLKSVASDITDIHFLDSLGEGTDLNQAWIQYTDGDSGSFKLGRQIYALDDHRFIGHVGWRQNIQTFDAATAIYNGIENLTLKTFYLATQNAVNGSNNDLDAKGINASYKVADNLTITGFHYEIKGEDTGNANASNETTGLRAVGSTEFIGKKLNYSFSIAEQEDTGPSSLDYTASYQAADLSTVLSDSKITVGTGLELMEAGFRTPLATVHKFNGFADALLPLGGFTNGLKDYYVYAGYKIPVGSGIKTKLIYHWFDSESAGSTGQDGGNELDLVASYKLDKGLSIVGKYGNYKADGGVGNAGAADKKMFTLELNLTY